MNKIILIIISTLISDYIHADVDDKWPSEQELSKAPTWPSKYTQRKGKGSNLDLTHK